MIQILSCHFGFVLLIITGLEPSKCQSFGLISHNIILRKHSDLSLIPNSNQNENQSPDEPFTNTPRNTRNNVSKLPSTELWMRAMNTSPRRIFLSSLSVAGISLASNFLGVTSNLLSTIPESTVEQSGLDVYFPRGEFKRFKSGEFKYTFVIMKEWVQDTSIELAKIQRKSRVLDYSIRTSNEIKTIPDAAFGPPAYLNQNARDTNLSVIVSKLPNGFRLEKLGPLNEAAEILVKEFLAPIGSGRKATLLDARAGKRGISSEDSYTIEYRVDRFDRGVPLKAISVIAVQGQDTLITMTIVAPEQDWEGEYENRLRKVADSFKLL